MSGGFSWARFLHDQGKQVEQIAQLRKDVQEVKGQLAALSKGQHETQVLVGSVRGAYKTIAIVLGTLLALAALAVKLWAHSGG